MSAVQELFAEPLTAAAFAPFGDVVQAAGDSRSINDGTAQQFADLALVDVADRGGRPRVSLYRARPRELPLPVRLLERHPLSSQLFMPLGPQPFLVVVAPPGDRIEPFAMRAFRTDGRQGVNYRRGTWHHPLIALDGPGEFLVIDRAGAGRDCEEFSFGDREILLYGTAR
jgi:ureidoglycolate lyase